MTDKDLPVIEVKGISKKYLISHEQKAQYGSLRDNIAGFVKKPFEKSGQNLSARQEIEEFWALKDVSFNVNKGEIFGIVGRNGSGKSTLLKTLSRIISPTKGEAIIRGRTASLLEVGTGFHPELTGRENIYFNGSMLGMSKSEISSKFNEIVEFAEIHRFLDTPVKFYSSGMYVRLAFSVAAHLEPDVLIQFLGNRFRAALMGEPAVEPAAVALVEKLECLRFAVAIGKHQGLVTAFDIHDAQV
jgi:lipopolysaccharide transport system ATP-binding protein